MDGWRWVQEDYLTLSSYLPSSSLSLPRAQGKAAPPRVWNTNPRNSTGAADHVGDGEDMEVLEYKGVDVSDAQKEPWSQKAFRGPKLQSSSAIN